MRLTRPATTRFEHHSFPTTTGDLIAAYGDIELDLPNGTVTLGEVLGRLPNERLQSAEEAQLATHCALSEAAIGRKGYSDRDPTNPGEQGHDVVSF